MIAGLYRRLRNNFGIISYNCIYFDIYTVNNNFIHARNYILGNLSKKLYGII